MFKGSEYAYYGMYLAGFAVMMIIDVLRCSHYGISKLRSVLMTLFTYAAGVSGAMLMGKIFTYIASKVGSDAHTNVAIFGAVIFCPMFLLLMFFVTEKMFDAPKSSWRDNMDLLAPGIFVILTFAKLGCFLDGCCYGFYWEHGIYNPTAKGKVFPVQLFEVASMIIVLIVADRLTYRNPKFIRGTAYPITAGLYCVTRFGWEFARYYEDDSVRYLFLGMSLWQICCLLVIIFSVIFCFFSIKARRKELLLSADKKAAKPKKKGKKR